jgi:acyl-CoA thioesterase
MTNVFENSLRLRGAGDGTYAREIDQTWWGWNGQFGGYALALALQACRLENTDPTQRERSITMHFLRRMPAGALRIDVVTERQGRTVTTFSLRMHVDGRLCAVGLVMLGSDRIAENFDTIEPPDLSLPPAGEMPKQSTIPGKALQNFTIWPRHDDDPISARAAVESGGWMCLADPGGADERFALMVADAYMPLSHLRFTQPAVGGTLDFTAHFREPVPDAVIDGTEPVRVHLTSARSHLGYVDEDAWIWTADGRLLLQSRQVRYAETVEDLDLLADSAGG